MVENVHETGTYPFSTYSLAIFTSGFEDSRFFLNGITKPMPLAPDGSEFSAPHSALTPVSEVTHQFIKSSVA